MISLGTSEYIIGLGNACCAVGVGVGVGLGGGGLGLGVGLNIKISSYQYRDPHVIFNMGIPIPGKGSLCIETGPRFIFLKSFLSGGYMFPWIYPFIHSYNQAWHRHLSQEISNWIDQTWADTQKYSMPVTGNIARDCLLGTLPRHMGDISYKCSLTEGFMEFI